MKPKFDHSGSTFESFLEEEGIREEVEATAMKCVLASQLEQHMLKTSMSKKELAKKLETSRSQLDRLLDRDNASISLITAARAAKVLGLRFTITLTKIRRPNTEAKSGKAVATAPAMPQRRGLAQPKHDKKPIAKPGRKGRQMATSHGD